MTKRSIKVGLWVAFVALTLNLFQMGQDFAAEDWHLLALHFETAIWIGCVMMCIIAMQTMRREISNLYDVLFTQIRHILKPQETINKALQLSQQIDEHIKETKKKQEENDEH